MKKFKMKTTAKLRYACSLLLLLNTTTHAQLVLKAANKQFALYNYAQAINLYTQAYQTKKTTQAVQGLAESYRLMRNYKQAESWYAIWQSMGNVPAETHRWYAEMLKANAKYSEAKVAFEKYQSSLKPLLPEQLKQLELWKAACDSAIQWMKNPKPISVLNETALNSPQADFGAVAYGSTIVFTSDRSDSPTQTSAKKPFLKFDGLTKLPHKKTYGATGNGYLQLYQKGIQENQISIFHLKSNNDYHIGTPSFSTDGNEVYFTRTRVPEKLARRPMDPSTIHVEIYSAKKTNGSWLEAVPFRYNNVQKWSVGDPFLTSDGQTLYFVSNMPGGKGGTDMYYCKRKADGGWDEAINLAALNTPGNERSVALNDKYFYFSTDGLMGMGGLDIYRAKIKGALFGKIENLGFPINSPQDDFAFSLSSSHKRFLSSNREGGLGSDDIYSYLDLEKIKIPFEGQILDKETQQPLANAVVTLTGANTLAMQLQADEQGKYKLLLDENSEYKLLAAKTNYMSTSTNFSTKGIDTDSTFLLDLALQKMPIETPMVLENIYYDFNKASIHPSSFATLNALVGILNNNPTIWVELAAHTDYKGPEKYNQWFSEMRALSVVRYLLRNGIDKSRIKAKGYGESKPIETCMPCTPQQNQRNRRTEFKIVKQ